MNWQRFSFSEIEFLLEMVINDTARNYIKDKIKDCHKRKRKGGGERENTEKNLVGRVVAKFLRKIGFTYACYFFKWNRLQ